MIRNLIIMNGAGLVIFEKIWVEAETRQTAKGSLFGSLLTAMQEMSRQSTRMIVSYIEFGKVAVSIVDDYKTKLICILFHDLEDGADFGKVIATQILASFLESFPEHSFSGTLNLSIFSGFTSKIFDAIQNAVSSIIMQLQTVRGIIHALVMFDDGTAVMSSNQEEDQLGIVANLQPLITFSTDIMMSKRERPKLVTLDMARQIVFVHRIGEACLVAVCKKNLKSPNYQSSIDHSVIMLTKVFALSRSLSFKSGKF
eukprot:TRINITY_DN2701_c0_g1_i1.p1 TRINITY_DN2701_c0_g1~~TRINITY_DN2701_c0_g1_i1.p1  ORF type:complete len:256 (-),score=29.08 TRINITY_DN2701_c0_g1_i1:61-828(-)